tara:strand:+ start:609 stop:962 length:354 start_codon:yes stop_codon:yes gene_type:complete
MKNILIVLLFLAFTSCQKDIADIVITGIVTDAKTSNPIEGAEITIVCWFYGNSPDQSYSDEQTKSIKTDSKGKYQIDFDKGAFIEIKITALGYNEKLETKYISGSKNSISINLEQKN